MTLNDKIAANKEVYNLILKAIRDVGFPIVIACVLLGIAYKWGDRLLISQENFVAKVGDEEERQTDLIKDIRDQQRTVFDIVNKQTLILEAHTQLLQKYSFFIEKAIENGTNNK